MNAAPTLAEEDRSAGVPGSPRCDLLIVGAGSAGLPAAIFAARRGAHVVLIDHADRIGGSLWVATGQMSAAGTRLQREKGIEDHPDLHFEDVMRISRGTANPGLVRRAVDNAAATFDWLMDEGFEPLPDHPVNGFGHEPYRLPRYYWGRDGGISIKDVLVPIVEELIEQGAVTLWLNHTVTALVQDGDGTITGASVRGPDGRVREIDAQAVLLTCGGYAGDPAEFARRNGVPQYNAAPWHGSRGAGLALGESVGGYARGAENLFCNFGTLFNTDNFPAHAVGRVEHFPERRAPWEIYVNANGQRFVREDLDSVDAREMALFHQPGQRYWIVFDHRILNEAPPIVVGWTREQMLTAFEEGGPSFLTGDTIADLAGKAGIDADGLARAIEGFNYGVKTGKDFLGRRHRPLPIEQSPFHAIRMQASSISSSIGLAVDEELRVIRSDGTPVGNLYAAGEILGSSQTMGKAACGGMMVTPAMTFGRLLGDHLIPLELGR
ncbi:MAG: FAD-dependent oxidoreductase [Sphingomonas sp.]|uniref:FAD-dependent oxidoreductase n=1 Tax=Sphingomonas sp. TaxID=28214 RepID=UPI001AD3C659|nr:FAD-dependent oxidoreductase [Sphingomonas sp.]MBN8814290.1 FAD-dependent oxidoreductase [Sphingomonas sp.]